MKVTYITKVENSCLFPLLNAIAGLYGQVERLLYVDLYWHNRTLKDCKREYLTRFGLTARQFNAIAADLRGKIESAREHQVVRIESLQRSISGTGKKIKTLAQELGRVEKAAVKAGKEAGKAKTAAAKARSEAEEVRHKLKIKRLDFEIHQKKRRLAGQRAKLEQLQVDRKEGRVRIAFGSRKLFRAQFQLRKNGFSDRTAWLESWRAARSAQFLCLGSKDEFGGNQTCSRMPDGGLRLRLPPALEGKWRKQVILDAHFTHGQEVIDTALSRGEAVTYRFVRKDQKGKEQWYIHTTVELPEAEITTSRLLGAIGADLNPGHLDIGEIDRFGNPIGSTAIPLDLRGRRSEQVKAMLAEAVAEIVDRAKVSGKPIVIEKLDFEEKKARLREQSHAYARMLSSFAYTQFSTLVHSRAAREGVEVIEINPAYSSVIGQVKFASGYGLSSHAAAAVAIARRGLRFGERLRSRTALPLPARNRGRHVWSDWGRVARGLRAERARGRRPTKGDHGRGIPLSLVAPTPAYAEQGPPSDGLAVVPGRDSPAQIVDKTVRSA